MASRTSRPTQPDHHPGKRATTAPDIPPVDRYVDTETPTRKLDRLVQTSVAPLTGNLSPIALGLAFMDWAWHLGASPGRQMELAALATQLATDTLRVQDGTTNGIGVHDDDPRFRAEDWAQWPFSQWRAGFRNAEAFWREASQVPGVSEHHTQLVDFFARQYLGMLTPANGLFSNPVVLKNAVQSGGMPLLRGVQNWLSDVTGVPTAEDEANSQRFQVGGNVAITPGKVIFRNELIELIRYEPQTPSVYPEPVLIIPSWIMKYYILDLSPHNSMVRYLVSQGHTVYMLSWRNPDAKDRDLSMEDYLASGVFAAMEAAGADAGEAVPFHAMGYCLGGTLLAIAAAAMARKGGLKGYGVLPPMKTLSLLAAQVDFTEPGELGLFIDEGQINLLDHITRGQGYLTGKQMAGSFQFLHSRALVWTRQMREYLMGEREQGNDLMAWNADTTRLPARMHHEYLVALYLKNALANGRYRVGGKPVSLNDLRVPVFAVGTERDHVSPWHSVYKLHRLTDAEITFALTSGGHNAGIISQPGRANRRHRIATRPERGEWQSADDWFASNQPEEGSWWPAWQSWLAEHSSEQVKARPIDARKALEDAPGSYVMQRYAE